MTLAEMKLMLKVGGWRLRSKSSVEEGTRNHRDWYVVDDKGDLRSRYYDSPWYAAEWGVACMTGDHEKIKQIHERRRLEIATAIKDKIAEQWNVMHMLGEQDAY